MGGSSKSPSTEALWSSRMSAQRPSPEDDGETEQSEFAVVHPSLAGDSARGASTTSVTILAVVRDRLGLAAAQPCLCLAVWRAALWTQTFT